jgi:hypothetical protein
MFSFHQFEAVVITLVIPLEAMLPGLPRWQAGCSYCNDLL